MHNKAIFFDVDGTLYTHSNHTIPQSAQNTLWELKEKGYKIGIATSRCRYELSNLPSFFRTFPFDGYVMDGGALVLSKEEIVHAIPVNVEDVYKIQHISRAHGFGFRYSTFDGDYIDASAQGWMMDEFFRLYLNFPTFKGYDGEDVYNILIYLKDANQIALIQDVLTACNMIIHTPLIIEITHVETNKAKGIERLCEYWNVDHDHHICFGDGANDVEMLKHAHIGVAMGNGCEAVKQAADFVSKSVDEDGIAYAVRYLNL